jgi:hypothetical protein
VTERPIIFNGQMVRALLAGTKTQTRRVMPPLKHPLWTGYSYFAEPGYAIENGPDYPDNDDDIVKCPFGKVGDSLWVRETWAHIYERADGQRFTERRDWVTYKRHWIEYRATSEEPPPTWRSPIHMSRATSRIQLNVSAVRVERLHDIKHADAAAEGWPGPDEKHLNASSWYAALWDSINAKRAPWASNPWVWVISFDIKVKGA